LIAGFEKSHLTLACVDLSSQHFRNAWHKLGAMPTEEAMQEYITIVQELFPDWDTGSGMVNSTRPYQPHSCCSLCRRAVILMTVVFTRDMIPEKERW
jgi:hypothetical protein